MKKPKNEEPTINEGHYLELMDRLYVLGDNFENHIMSHQLVQQLNDKKLSKQLHKALEGIYKAYQRVGQLDYEHNYDKEEDNVE